MALSLGARSCAAGLLLAALQPAGAAAQPTAVGSEFEVNTYTTNVQVDPSVAADADGDFVVVWESFTSPGGDTGKHWSCSSRTAGVLCTCRRLPAYCAGDRLDW